MTKINREGMAIGLISLAALGFLMYLIYGRDAQIDAGRWAFLPTMNALCNSITTLFILSGLFAIHRENKVWHRRFMLGAFGSSTVFLLGYIVYHYAHGDSHFLGQGWIRPVYFTILISHIFLSAVVLPMVLTTFFLALAGRFTDHKKWARFTYPLWLYVSVTGVGIYFFLKAYT